MKIKQIDAIELLKELPNNNNPVDIIGYEGHYQICEDGTVISVSRPQTGAVMGFRSKRVLKYIMNNNGYYYVSLRLPKMQPKRMYIHRLIAIHFIPNPLNLPIINHKNGIKTDNRIDNLEWCTHKHNSRHSFDVLGNTGSHLNRFSYDHNRSITILQYTTDNVLIAEYGSGHEAMRCTGVLQQNISKVLNGHRNTAGGFIWKYK